MLILTDVMSLNDDLIVVDVIPPVVIEPPFMTDDMVILQTFL